MPDADGRFLGAGWSRAREDAWLRVFGPVPTQPPREVLEASERLDVGFHDRRLLVRLADPDFAAEYKNQIKALTSRQDAGSKA